jgi:phage baseplate assembly protein W|tara:strand:- start:404 stop:814 length:411 start_codon:yes stop_codon:yes gene_type:complete
MAINATRIYPIDNIPSKAVGISIPFNGPAVFKSNYTTKDAIRNNLINLLLTGPNERPFRPGFGAGLQAFVFEQLAQDNIDGIKDYIEVAIGQYFPDIQATVELRADPDQNSLYTVIDYTITNTGITDTIQLNLNNA